MESIKKLEKVFKALGDHTRLRIINMLLQKPMCVCEITSILPLSQSTISGHLKVLKEADIVTDKKDGLWVIYSLNNDHLEFKEIIKTLKKSFILDKMLIKENVRSLNASRDDLCKK